MNDRTNPSTAPGRERRPYLVISFWLIAVGIFCWVVWLGASLAASSRGADRWAYITMAGTGSGLVVALLRAWRLDHVSNRPPLSTLWRLQPTNDLRSVLRLVGTLAAILVSLGCAIIGAAVVSQGQHEPYSARAIAARVGAAVPFCAVALNRAVAIARAYRNK